MKYYSSSTNHRLTNCPCCNFTIAKSNHTGTHANPTKKRMRRTLKVAARQEAKKMIGREDG